MTVAMVVSEMEPFAKTGGLADVAGALPLALGRLGVQVHVIVPRYSVVQEKQPQVKISEGVEVHFIDHEDYFQRIGLYGGSNGDYPDNLDRFSFFCRQSLSLLKEKGIRPDILHAHDWQAALSIVYQKSVFQKDPFFARMRSVFTIHNLAYQGLFPKDQYPRCGLPWELFHIDGLEYYDKVNLLKGGLVFADRLTTVSPTYAREIQIPDQGEGLEGVLRFRSKDLLGILNGIDQDLWNPATDRALGHRFDSKRLAGKAKNKEALQKEMKLPVSSKIPLMGMVTRLASQKGLDLVVQALPGLSPLGVQLVVLGSGDRPIEQALESAAKNSSTVRVHLGFDANLARRIYAGSDLFLMPSRYEPCGLGQMIAMRYGAVPLVRSTGGLADTVREDGLEGNGFCFRPYDSQAFLQAVQRAVGFYRASGRWKVVQLRGMTTDFSWRRSAREYLRLYEKISYKD